LWDELSWKSNLPWDPEMCNNLYQVTLWCHLVRGFSWFTQL
jgi:hypothetical protein